MCRAARHNTVRAYREARCRCPEIVDRMRAMWRRRYHHGLTAHVPKSRDTHLDDIAIERAMAGDLVTLTIRERAVVVARLTDRGLSAKQIASRMHMSTRTITRYRAGLIKTAA